MGTKLNSSEARERAKARNEEVSSLSSERVVEPAGTLLGRCLFLPPPIHGGVHVKGFSHPRKLPRGVRAALTM